MEGFLTNERCFHAHVFADDYSDFTRGYHAKLTDVTDDIQAKHACERETHNDGKQVRHHHAGNSSFSCKDCKDEVHKHKESIIYCTVGTHFQNGKAEDRIKNTCTVARTTLISAINKWPQLITPSLSLFAASTAIAFH